MLSDIAHQRGQALLRQRKILLVAAAASFLTNLALVSALSTRDREVILQPISSRPLAISSSGVSADYLELVTRDVALMLLNRSPAGLDYWMEQILKLADPASYGALKAELVKIVTEQRGSDLSQAFVITGMTVDPKALSSTVEGDLKTFVGGQVIASETKRFRFGWSYVGLRLSLTSFALISQNKEAFR
ncbi:type IV conjugative transfer system protein TraE [Sphingomonas profundi]|uniref:type IV conjugative transfer system protein TraE n=1 Tax=Alterirhizorhabdus profundi TaxID=2681549 RepID=UPI0012E8D1F3|nr:type IV conjugative transfer system protein TraE [Sphingomonas profundi]